jgi:hypothetical protein
MIDLTYTVNITSDQVMATDTAIGTFLMLHPDASVDDALDTIFSLGVQAMIKIDGDEGTPA